MELGGQEGEVGVEIIEGLLLSGGGGFGEEGKEKRAEVVTRGLDITDATKGSLWRFGSRSFSSRLSRCYPIGDQTLSPLIGCGPQFLPLPRPQGAAEGWRKLLREY